MYNIGLFKLTSLESGAAGYEIVEQRLVEEQGAFLLVFVVVEILARRHVETFRSAPEPTPVLHGVRFVRAAPADVRVGRLAQLGSHNGDENHLTEN